LDEGHAHRPCGFTIVSNDPGFSEFTTSLDLEFVANAFLDKATQVPDKLSLLFKGDDLFQHLFKLTFNNLFYRLSLGLKP
jgi:hypothetical protein